MSRYAEGGLIADAEKRLTAWERIDAVGDCIWLTPRQNGKRISGYFQRAAVCAEKAELPLMEYLERNYLKHNGDEHQRAAYDAGVPFEDIIA